MSVNIEFFSPFLRTAISIMAVILISLVNSFAQPDKQSEVILSRAIQILGGDRYLSAASQYGRGKYSVIKDGAVVSFQSFADVIVYPDTERTEFKGAGAKSVQTNVGNGGWLLDGDTDLIKDQSESQVRNFKNSLRVSLDYLLRRQWRNQATLAYVGKRPASLGKRNDVVRLTYNDDGMAVEFEFADDGLPAKAVYKRTSADNEEVTEEDRYAQFVEVDGIKAPFIIDHYTNGKQTSRINYESLEFNKRVPDSIFLKPSNPKDLKKDLKL